MCSSLANNGYRVFLVVADGKGDELVNNINIIDAGSQGNNRLTRMIVTTRKVFEKAVGLDAVIYHLHDPELIPFAGKFQKKGKKVIFDAHEDVPLQILSKPYLSKPVALSFSKLIELYEKIVYKKVDFIITATPVIRNKFSMINNNTVDINNFPLLNELYSENSNVVKQNEICYIGGLSKVRGIKELVLALEHSGECKLNLAGIFKEKDYENEVIKTKGWEKVIYHGHLNRKEIKTILSKSKAGMVTLLPIKNYIESQPVKMFEYMSAGLPVISSNFPLWKEIVEGNNCGICVNPDNPLEIAKAIQYIFDNHDITEQMGKNGRQAVIEKYNWEIEEKKLLNVYEQLLKS
jgi:glycosyltransferase involved in cell wall biosynthesis